MVRPIVCLALLSLLAFQSSYCIPARAIGNDKLEQGITFPPQSTTPTAKTTTPLPSSTPAGPNTTTTPNPTPTTTTPSSTTPPSSSTTPPPSNSTTTVAPPTSSTTPTTTTHSPSSSSSAPPTTEKPNPPQPSDRKFDAMSFLGGFSLGLGLVAIGILSWRFYLSRQENYYHTL